jgi:hypothetical protein
MPFPTTAFGIAAIIVLLVPGLVYALVRRALKGFRYDDLTIDARIAQALVVSVVLDSVYLVAAWAWIGGLVTVTVADVDIEKPVQLGLAVLVGAFAIPGLIAALLYSPFRLRRRTPKPPRHPKPARRKFPLRLERTVYYNSVPTAWDWGATNPGIRMVRVLLPDGRYLGGLFGPGSYVSTYPEPRDIYISHQYHINSDGSFGAPAERAAGIWLRIGDHHIVEFFEPSYTEEQLKEIEHG